MFILTPWVSPVGNATSSEVFFAMKFSANNVERNFPLCSAHSGLFDVRVSWKDAFTERQ